MNRKTFLKHSGQGLSALALGSVFTSCEGSATATAEKSAMATTASTPIAKGEGLTKKSLKFGMIKGDMSVMDKFKLIKELGFDGIELDSPNDLNEKEILAARDATGLEIPGTVNSLHWKKPLSHPDPAVRAECVESMKNALRATKRYGGTTVLLVPAVVNADVSYADAYKRSQEEIRKIIPVAEETGIKIAFENVWNNFLLSPLEAAQYVDEFDHELIGWYFDVGNIVRYGWPEHWVRTLGHRIMKVDIKEYSRKKANEEGVWEGFKAELTEGDSDWSKVNAALRDVGYTGWGSAEVPGGDRERLQHISEMMDKAYAS